MPRKSHPRELINTVADMRYAGDNGKWPKNKRRI